MSFLLLVAFLAGFQAPALARSGEAAASIAGVPIGEDSEGSFGLDAKEDLPNFHMVSTGVYRLGQPNAEGLAALAGLGVRTVLSLRERVSEQERREVQRLGMRMESVPMSGLFTPSFEQIDRALGVLADPAKRPVAVHCRFGKDRTGYAVAAWQVKTSAADLDAAVAEARRYGCCLPTWKDLKTFIIEYSRR